MREKAVEPESFSQVTGELWDKKMGNEMEQGEESKGDTITPRSRTQSPFSFIPGRGCSTKEKKSIVCVNKSMCLCLCVYM